MAYIGRDTDKISNIEKLDTITFDGSSSYTLQKNSVNFTPNSANSLQVSIDGVVQAGNFTVSGSVIDFGVAIPATSTNDFIFHYGTGLITTPADGTVTTAKLADSSVSLAKLTATGTKDSTTFLRGDNTFAEAGGGKVLQVVQASTTTAYTTSSSSYVAASGMQVSITPSATSSKVLVFVTMNFQEGVAGSGAYATIYRNNTTNLEANGFVYHGLASGASYKFSSQEPMHYLDSPNTTSATTYTVYFARDGSGSATVNFNNSRGVITAIEIGA